MASNDLGWGYGKPVEGKGNAWVVCDFCNFLSKGGITRHKHHLVGDSPSVKKCTKVPVEVQKRFKDEFQKRKQHKEELNKIPHFNDAIVDLDDKDEEDTTNSDFFHSKSKRPMSSSGSAVNTKNPTKGPLDVMYPPSEKTRKTKGYLVGTSEHKEFHKKLRLDAVQKICRWMYDAVHRGVNVTGAYLNNSIPKKETDLNGKN
ncbi:unnamed protein product [Lactuca saligna]|uniref:BED-type domain-containing protein n=1 Tax=Lactuca saligna TaxID=75948 RepID=A0AA36EHF0_LACSI|nr:unnamed protein product [Lactuca saligna]